MTKLSDTEPFKNWEEREQERHDLAITQAKSLIDANESAMKAHEASVEANQHAIKHREDYIEYLHEERRSRERMHDAFLDAISGQTQALHRIADAINRRP